MLDIAYKATQFTKGTNRAILDSKGKLGGYHINNPDIISFYLYILFNSYLSEATSGMRSLHFP